MVFSEQNKNSTSHLLAFNFKLHEYAVGEHLLFILNIVFT